jgi:hypothetical protein
MHQLWPDDSKESIQVALHGLPQVESCKVAGATEEARGSQRGSKTCNFGLECVKNELASASWSAKAKSSTRNQLAY